MVRWRYHSMVLRDLSICEAKLNAEGEKGWELVSVFFDGNNTRAFFKMPVDGHAVQESLPDVALVGQNPFDLPDPAQPGALPLKTG